MANIDEAYTVDVLSFDDKTLIVSGESDPAVGVGYEAPIGSLYIRANGLLYQKNNTADVDWDTFRMHGEPATDLPALMLGIVSNAAIQQTYASVDWNTTHLANDTDTIERDAINHDRVYVREAGLYLVAYSLSVDANATATIASARVVINGVTVVPGSDRLLSGDGNIYDLGNTCVVELAVNDYVTVEVQANDNGILLHDSSNCCVMRAAGIKGATGPVGSGSNVTIEQDGIPVVNTPHNILDFTKMTATDSGSGKVIIQNVFGSEFQIGQSVGLSTTTSNIYQNKVTLVTGSLPTGLYRIGFSYGWNHDSRTDDFEARMQEDAVNMGEIHKQEPKDDAGTFGTSGTSQRIYSSRVFYRTLTGSHTYTLDFKSESSGSESSIWEAIIDLWRIE